MKTPLKQHHFPLIAISAMLAASTAASIRSFPWEIIDFFIFAYYTVASKWLTFEMRDEPFWNKPKYYIQKSLQSFLVLVSTAPTIIAGDYLHLALAYPFYATKIVAQPNANDQTKFRWGDSWLFLGDKATNDLVYDPMDSLKSEIGKIRSDSKRQEIKIQARHLIGHFYIEQTTTD